MVAARCLQMFVNGQTTHRWVYKDAINPVAELDSEGNVETMYIYGANPFTPQAMVRDGITYRIVSDMTGSVRLVVNAETGAVVQRIDYDSFGRIINDTNPGFQPFGFQGGLHDPATGLVRFGAREYDPETARWLSKDPIRHNGGLNLYVFAGNDPVNRVDPVGLCEEKRSSGRGWLDRLYPDYSVYGSWINSMNFDPSERFNLQILDAHRGVSSYWHIPTINGAPRPDLTLGQVEKMNWEQIASEINGQSGNDFFDNDFSGPTGIAKVLKDFLSNLLD